MHSDFKKYPRPETVWVSDGGRNLYTLKSGGRFFLRKLEVLYGSPLDLIEDLIQYDWKETYHSRIDVGFGERKITILRNPEVDSIVSFSSYQPVLSCNHPLWITYLSCLSTILERFDIDKVVYKGRPCLQKETYKWVLYRKYQHLKENDS